MKNSSRNLSRLLSLVMACVMCLSCLPATAFAVGPEDNVQTAGVTSGVSYKEDPVSNVWRDNNPFWRVVNQQAELHTDGGGAVMADKTVYANTGAANRQVQLKRGTGLSNTENLAKITMTEDFLVEFTAAAGTNIVLQYDASADDCVGNDAGFNPDGTDKPPSSVVSWGELTSGMTPKIFQYGGTTEDGYDYIDQLGEYMEVKRIEGIWLGGVNIPVTDLGNGKYSVKSQTMKLSLGVLQLTVNTSGMTLEVVKSSDPKTGDIVKLHIPDGCMGQWAIVTDMDKNGQAIYYFGGRLQYMGRSIAYFDFKAAYSVGPKDAAKTSGSVDLSKLSSSFVTEHYDAGSSQVVMACGDIEANEGLGSARLDFQPSKGVDSPMNMYYYWTPENGVYDALFVYSATKEPAYLAYMLDTVSRIASTTSQLRKTYYVGDAISASQFCDRIGYELVGTCGEKDVGPVRDENAPAALSDFMSGVSVSDSGRLVTDEEALDSVRGKGWETYGLVKEDELAFYTGESNLSTGEEPGDDLLLAERAPGYISPEDDPANKDLLDQARPMDGASTYVVTKNGFSRMGLPARFGNEKTTNVTGFSEYSFIPCYAGHISDGYISSEATPAMSIVLGNNATMGLSMAAASLDVSVRANGSPASVHEDTVLVNAGDTVEFIFAGRNTSDEQGAKNMLVSIAMDTVLANECELTAGSTSQTTGGATAFTFKNSTVRPNASTPSYSCMLEIPGDLEPGDYRVSFRASADNAVAVDTKDILLRVSEGFDAALSPMGHVDVVNAVGDSAGDTESLAVTAGSNVQISGSAALYGPFDGEENDAFTITADIEISGGEWVSGSSMFTSHTGNVHKASGVSCPLLPPMVIGSADGTQFAYAGVLKIPADKSLTELAVKITYHARHTSGWSKDYTETSTIDLTYPDGGVSPRSTAKTEVSVDGGKTWTTSDIEITTGQKFLVRMSGETEIISQNYGLGLSKRDSLTMTSNVESAPTHENSWTGVAQDMPGGEHGPWNGMYQGKIFSDEGSAGASPAVGLFSGTGVCWEHLTSKTPSRWVELQAPESITGESETSKIGCGFAYMPGKYLGGEATVWSNVINVTVKPGEAAQPEEGDAHLTGVLNARLNTSGDGVYYLDVTLTNDGEAVISSATATIDVPDFSDLAAGRRSSKSLTFGQIPIGESVTQRISFDNVNVAFSTMCEFNGTGTYTTAGGQSKTWSAATSARAWVQDEPFDVAIKIDGTTVDSIVDAGGRITAPYLTMLPSTSGTVNVSLEVTNKTRSTAVSPELFFGEWVKDEDSWAVGDGPTAMKSMTLSDFSVPAEFLAWGYSALGVVDFAPQGPVMPAVATTPMGFFGAKVPLGSMAPGASKTVTFTMTKIGAKAVLANYGCFVAQATNDNSFGTTGYVGSESFDMFGLREYAFDLDLDVIHNGESIRNKGLRPDETYEFEVTMAHNDANHAGLEGDFVCVNPVLELTTSSGDFEITSPNATVSGDSGHGFRIAKSFGSMSKGDVNRIRFTIETGPDFDGANIVLNSKYAESLTGGRSTTLALVRDSGTIIDEHDWKTGLTVTTSGPSSLQVGETAEFGVTIKNDASAVCLLHPGETGDGIDAISPGVNITLPRGVKFVSATKDYVANGRTYSWTMNKLAPGVSATWKIKVQAVSNDTSGLTMKGICGNSKDGQYVKTHALSITGGGSSEDETFTLSLVPGVTAEPLTVKSGEEITLTLNVANSNKAIGSNGTSKSVTASNVSGKLTLPAGFVVSDNGGLSVSNNKLSWNIGSLDYSKRATAVVKVKAPDISADKNYTFDLSVTNSLSDTADTASRAVTVKANNGGGTPGDTKKPNLVLGLTADKTSVKPGEDIKFTLTMENKGDGYAENPDIAVAIPTGMTVDPRSLTAGTISGQTISIKASGQDAGKKLTVNFTSKIAVGEPGSKLTVASVLKYSNNPDGANKSIRKSVAITLTEGVGQVSGVGSVIVNNGKPNAVTYVKSGDEVRYEIKVTNTGTAVAKKASLNVKVPAGFALKASGVSDGGAFDGKDLVTWSLPDIPVSGSVTVSMTGKIDKSASGSLAATGEMMFAGQDKQVISFKKLIVKSGSDNIGAGELKFSMTGFVSGSKDSSKITTGDVITVTANVENTGAGPVDEIMLAVQIPNGLTVDQSSVTDGGLWVPNNSNVGSFAGGVAYVIGSLEAGESKSVSFKATGSDITKGNIYLVSGALNGTSVSDGKTLTVGQKLSFTGVESSGNNGGGNHTGVDLDGLNILLEQKAAAGVFGTNDLVVKNGDEIVYRLTLKNNGDTDLSNIQVFNIVPKKLRAEKPESAELKDGRWIWTVESLKSGESVEISYSGKISDIGADVIENNFSVSAGGKSAVSNKVKASAGGVSSTGLKLVMQQKTSGEFTDNLLHVKGGDTVHYQIGLRNEGRTDYTGMTMSVKLPEGASASNISNNGVLTDGVITWDLGNIAAGYGSSFTFDMGIPNTPGASLDWTVMAYLSDGVTTSNKLSLVLNAAHVTVTQEYAINGGEKGTDATANPGDRVTYYLTVKNDGSVQADDVIINNKLPENVTLLEDSIKSNGKLENGILRWRLGSLSAGKELVLEFSVQIPNDAKEQTWVNQTSAQFANDTNNMAGYSPDVAYFDHGVTSTTVRKAGTTAKLEISMKEFRNGREITDTDKTIGVGDKISFEITIKNVGDAPALGIFVGNGVPSGLTVDEASISDSGVLANGVIGWSVSSLEPGQSKTVTFNAVVASAGSGAKLVDKAYVQFENNPDNTETRKAVIEVVGRELVMGEYDSGIGIELSAVADGNIPVTAESNLKPGQVVRFTILIRNGGGMDRTNVIITDSLPDGWTPENITGGGTYRDGVITWNVGTLKAGENHAVSFSVTLPSINEARTWTNQANVGADDVAKTPSNQVTFKEMSKDMALVQTGLDNFSGPMIMVLVLLTLIAMGAFLTEVYRRRKAYARSE